MRSHGLVDEPGDRLLLAVVLLDEVGVQRQAGCR
jgi:hypothetical protein